MLTSLENLSLSVGAHKNNEGACVMELVSYLANEPFSDSPACASPSITAFCIFINDNGDQKHRDRLQELAPKIVNTRDSTKEPARALLYADFAKWCSNKAAEYAAKYAAKSAEYAAKSAKYAAEYAAKYAAEYAEYAAKYAAEYAAEYATFRKELYAKALETLEKVLAV